MDDPIDHELEFLLAFDGRIHWLDRGYRIKIMARRIAAVPGRPHGVRYSLTLHAPDGSRLLGFDNAHELPRRRGARRPSEWDHYHRNTDDPGRPYEYRDAATLISDFFNEVERVLESLGIGTAVRSVEEPEE